jgi:signal peptidase I
MFRLLKVSGNSLQPVYQKGDFVLVSKIPYLFVPPEIGDVVVFRHQRHGTMIKRIARVSAERDEIFVVGTGEGSVDSRRFGAIQKSDIVGKVIWHVKRSDSA